MPLWVQILLGVLKGTLDQQGKTEASALLTDALRAHEAGHNVDVAMQGFADAWVANGEPTHESIVAARKEIQAAIGD